MRPGLPLLVSAACALVASPAGAHTENSDGYSTIRVEASRISYDLFLDTIELARVVRLGVGRGAAPSDLRRALSRNVEEIQAYLEKRLQVSIDGVACPARVASANVERRLDRDYAHLGLELSCPGTRPGGVLVKYALLFDDSDSSHRNLVHYEADGTHGQFVFTATQRELRLGRGTPANEALRFVELGLRHILGGYDHVLFVVALLLGTTSLLGVLRVLSLFTLAHSMTLAAALLGIARFPASIVEPLIALSIAYVAAESLLPARSRFRSLVVFGFGLVHGMGFAGAIQMTGARGWAVAVPLLSFNFGIELGQALIVLLAFPLLLMVRRLSWSRLAHGMAQCCISSFGLVWYFERLFS